MIIFENNEFQREKENSQDMKLLFLPLEIESENAIMIYYCNTKYPYHDKVASVIINTMGLGTYYESKYSRIPSDVFLIFCGFVLIDIYQKYNARNNISETPKLLICNEKLAHSEYVEWAKNFFKMKDNDISEYTSDDEFYSEDMKAVMNDNIIQEALERYRNEIIKNITLISEIKGEYDGR